MVHFYTRISFVGGLILGVILAVLLKKYLDSNNELIIKNKHNSYDKWLKKQGIIRKKDLLWDSIRYGNKNYLLESEFLFKKINILCIVLVKTLNNFKAANNTWLKGCNTVKLVDLTPNKSKSNTLVIKRKQEDSSWIHLCKTLTEVDSFDWVLIVNDNTFVISENLRYYVAALKSNKKYYLGHAVSFWGTAYNTAAAGYVLSKGSVKAFQKKMKNDGCASNSYWNREDFYLGRSLASLNITPIDTKDEHGLSLFHPYNWYHLFYPGEGYFKMSVFPTKCCSKRSITFQAVEGDKMYKYYYLLYTLQIFLDGNLGNKKLPKLGPDDMVWKEFLKERGIQSETITSKQYYKLWEDLIQDPNSFAKNMKKEVDSDYD